MTVIFIQGRFTKPLQKFCQERFFFVNQIIPPCKLKLLGKLLPVYKFTPLKDDFREKLHVWLASLKNVFAEAP